jgi:pimeloyl-ACP methyl ester carboxylesterase
MPQIRANGIDIEFESFGRDSDPAILLIMGFSAQLTLWPVALCEGLAARGFRVIRFDNRDIGKSTHLMDKGAPDIGAMMAKAAAGEAVKGPYALEDMADDAAALLDVLGIARAHIVGASMGGMIAQIFALRHPGKTKSLTSIMSTTGRRDLPPARPEAMAALLTPPASGSREHRIEAALRTWRAIGSPGVADADRLADAAFNIDRVPYEPIGVARQLAAILAAQPRNEALKTLKTPTLVLHGAEDPLILPDAAKDTAASIPGAKLVIVPGMGHDLARTIEPAVRQYIGDFVSGVEASA